ncbi:thioredoxin family protein [Riemerella columbipharyngis]|uniref:Thioredoxin-like domain-containing protein n=1 Tax=Riemerella columbipharyngis TaxID=1071918 RepID=A0A1G7DKS0_9FLAO|nr:thioredoxin family protein [Riemerella columbipharyngis]SDE52102.1 Thioredoxin-like domain-containing protein [Riemerella columbipharyngis]
MKKLTLILSLFLIGIMNAQQVKWMTFDEAVAAQKKEPKKIIMDIYAPWCGPCKQMLAKTYGNPNIAKMINDNFYAVKFNGEGDEKIHYSGMVFGNPNYRPNVSGKNAPNEFTIFLGVEAYPTTIFIDTDGNIITNLRGFFPPKELEPYLSLFKADDYKKIKTKEEWDDYQKKIRANSSLSE